MKEVPDGGISETAEEQPYRRQEIHLPDAPKIGGAGSRFPRAGAAVGVSSDDIRLEGSFTLAHQNYV